MTGAEASSTAGLLEALDRVREVRGSLPLFDALVADDPARVRGALAQCPRHPLREGLVAWLADRGLTPEEAPGPSDALARHGVTDVDAWVAERDRREIELGRSLADARAERDLALRSANAYALVSALLAALAIGGWLAAFGGFPVPGQDVASTPAPASTRPSGPEAK